MRGSANGLQTSAATSGAQMVSESTSATRSVDAAFHPLTSASRLPGTSVITTVTGYREAISWQTLSEASMTRMTSSTPLASQDWIAVSKMTGSSWYTGTAMLIVVRKLLTMGLYSTAGMRRMSQHDQRNRPSTPRGVPST